jgi:hypothetical protein
MGRGKLQRSFVGSRALRVRLRFLRMTGEIGTTERRALPGQEQNLKSKAADRRSRSTRAFRHNNSA